MTGITSNNWRPVVRRLVVALLWVVASFAANAEEGAGGNPVTRAAADPAAPQLLSLLERYVEEAETVDHPTDVKPALPVPGAHPQPLEDLLMHIEGWHLWRARGRDDLAQQALARVRALEAELSGKLGASLANPVQQALNAKVLYSQLLQPLEAAAYWPEGEPPSGATAQGAPGTPRWVRGVAPPVNAGSALRSSRRIGSTDGRWWPSFQQAYIDMAYRGLPQLLRRQLARAGNEQYVFRVWHAGAEDGSQTFLLAALLDEAAAIVAADPGHPELAAKLEHLRIEIIATDYAYMPQREDRTYRFDVSGNIGELQLKWNLLAEETGPVPDAKAWRQQRAQVPAQLEAASTAQRAEYLRQLTDSGWVGALLGRLLVVSPGVDFAPGDTGMTPLYPQYRYHFADQRWRIEELGDGVLEVVSPGTPQRLIRFELGDMTEALPHGFARGNAFDLSLVTGVIPYIYGYYRQQGDADRMYQRAYKDGPRKTPMERAQDNLAFGAREGGWIVIDPATERHALAARDLLHNLDDNYPSWADAWINWVRSTLAGREVELHLTHPDGLGLVDPARYGEGLSTQD